MAIEKSTNPINGSNGILFVWNETASEYQPVACLTSTTFGLSTESNEQAPTKCNPNEIRKIKGATSYTLSAEAEIFEDANNASPQAKASFKELYDLHEDENLIFKYDFNTENQNSFVKYFNGFISELESTQDVNENSTFSLSVEVKNKPTSQDPNAI